MMKNNFYKLENPIQNYSWGSKTSISTLFGIDNKHQEPQAEIWMGAHPNGCSKVIVEGKSVLLSTLINEDKIGVLSKSTAEFYGELPYLFKVLAADQALSVQVHPNKEEAEQGFIREEARGIDRLASNRNYRDANHKPELVYALTSYQAMNGFRSFKEILALFTQLLSEAEMPAVDRLVDSFKHNMTPEGLEAFFTGVLSLSGDEKHQSICALLEYASKHQHPEIDNDLNALVMELAKTYPNDIGLFSPFMLNVLTLKPGEAMYLDARTPHAYLKGTGLEIMANSDNVLRAGLTPKHIDVVELTKCTLFEEKPSSSLLLEPEIEGGKLSYPVPVQDFKFDCFIQADAVGVAVDSAEIVFAIDDDALLEHVSGETMLINRGESAFIPAYAKEYKLTSSGRIARAYN
jgi:mannose-6-phosphate isomerase